MLVIADLELRGPEALATGDGGTGRQNVRAGKEAKKMKPAHMIHQIVQLGLALLVLVLVLGPPLLPCTLYIVV